MKVIALHKYAAVRSLANRVKDPTDAVALTTVAAEMAAVVPPGAVLVPAPSSSGQNVATRALAQRVADQVVGARMVEAVLRHAAVPPSHILRVAGLPALTVEQHLSSMERIEVLADDAPLFIVDNVVTSGRTALAIETLVNLPMTLLVYADGSRGPLMTRINPTHPPHVLISGSREYASPEKVRRVLEGLVGTGAVVVHGGARGVDTVADECARALGLKVEVYPADWAKYGRSAGPRRNREMVAMADYVYAFWDGKSRGTASTIQAARDAGVPYEVIL